MFVTRAWLVHACAAKLYLVGTVSSCTGWLDSRETLYSLSKLLGGFRVPTTTTSKPRGPRETKLVLCNTLLRYHDNATCTGKQDVTI